MEAAIGPQPQLYYAMPAADDWDPHHWRWDGDLFLATRLSSNTSSSSYSDESKSKYQRLTDLDFEKKRRSDTDNHDLALNLGGQGFAQLAPGKKTKFAGATPPNRAACQVEDCRADLSKSKDYHRRHKVCEMHSKASRALVANQMQRFCQQCSRFHALQEFDEGKRSCRRRLAGHNKRRRKTQTDNGTSNIPVNDSRASGYLLMSILKILSNMHSNRSNHTDDQDLLSHLLQSLSSQGNPELESQNLLNNMPSLGNPELESMLLSNGSQREKSRQELCTTPDDVARKDGCSHTTCQTPGIVSQTQTNSQIYTHGKENCGGRSKLNDFDLNDVYVDSDDGTDDIERSTVAQGLGTVSVGCPLWVQQESHQSSPPQTSGNLDSTSAQSPSSSSGEAQSYTDRIIFKLFGKDPSDFPIVLRTQIFDWLSHSPSDIESYIRPGCVILTIYLRLPELAWEEIYCDLGSSLSRLLNFSKDDQFWSTGWIYTRVKDQIAFVYNGRVILNTSLPLGTNKAKLSIKPIAVTPSGQAQFFVKGFNLSRPSTRLLCSLEGNYLEIESKPVECGDGVDGQVQCCTFPCSIPAVNGRGFIEVEDHAMSDSFFPFIIAEDDVCTEIRMLEEEIEMIGAHNSRGIRCDVQNKAMDFIHEMGWLLHKLQSKPRFGHDPSLSYFSFDRFKHLVEFSVDRDWCAVVNKLLNILFCGIVSIGEQPLLRFALSEMGLLHRAVRRNSRTLIEMLLRYVPENVSDELSSEFRLLIEELGSLFRPDVAGPGGLTPLHVAAGRDGSEDILDALTDDPGKVGIGAWKSARDSAGFTPEDYARLRGHYTYIHLVQRKINMSREVQPGHVAVDISDNVSSGNMNKKLNDTHGFEVERSGMKGSMQQVQPCGVCAQKLARRAGSRTLLYRPAMMTMLTIAAVCVCVALLFKSYPRVLFVFRPFRWEMLEYGSS